MRSQGIEAVCRTSHAFLADAWRGASEPKRAREELAENERPAALRIEPLTVISDVSDRPL